MSRFTRPAWLCALIFWLASAAPAPASAGPRTRAQHGVTKAHGGKPSRASRPKAGGKRRTAAKAPSRGKAKVKVKVAPRPHRDAARVTIAGAVRGPSETRGRSPAIATTADERTADAIDEILQGPLRYGTTGLYVVDAATGRELFAIHADDPLNPASNVKLLSTATALDLLGPEFRYATRLLGPSPDADGAVVGDVYLHGSYDPTLAVAGLDQLARAIAARGVRRIDGDLVVGGPSTRDGIYRARVRVEVAAGAPGAAPTVTAGPASDFLEVVNTATTGKRARVKGRLTVTSKLIERDGHARLQISVAGPIGKGKSVARFLTTKERHLYAAHLVRAALIRAGVEVTGDVHLAELDAFVAAANQAGHLPIVLAERASAPLADIVSQVNKRSINWLSDRVIATAVALTADQLPSMAPAVDAMYAWLEHSVGVARKDAVIDSGSGLSYRTELSPRQLVKIMRVATGADAPVDAHRAACAAAFRHSLSIAGVDGTLRGRFRSGLRGRVIGKTGTLTGVIALSGLLEGADGRALAFSFVTNGHTTSRKLGVRAAHEQLLGVLDRYLSETATATAVTPPAAEVAVATAPALDPEAAPTEGDDADDADDGSDLADDGEAEAGPAISPGDSGQ